MLRRMRLQFLIAPLFGVGTAATLACVLWLAPQPAGGSEATRIQGLEAQALLRSIDSAPLCASNAIPSVE